VCSGAAAPERQAMRYGGMKKEMCSGASEGGYSVANEQQRLLRRRSRCEHAAHKLYEPARRTAAAAACEGRSTQHTEGGRCTATSPAANQASVDPRPTKAESGAGGAGGESVSRLQRERADSQEQSYATQEHRRSTTAPSNGGEPGNAQSTAVTKAARRRIAQQRGRVQTHQRAWIPQTERQRGGVHDPRVTRGAARDVTPPAASGGASDQRTETRAEDADDACAVATAAIVADRIRIPHGAQRAGCPYCISSNTTPS